MVTLHPKTGKPVTHILKPQEIDAILKKYGLAKKEDAPSTQPATAHA